MALFKCKMCGGALEITPNASVIECEYCGTPQTLPKLHDEKLNNMFERADQFRRAKDFDKALELYEEILTEKNDDSEVYWSIVLCRYGIEYVDDPKSGQKIPTVNRAQFTSIFDDTDYQSAIVRADSLQKMLYEKEAAAINEIQKGILTISNNEEPYDVFICYKETDENGERTHDSVYATELYYELTEMGYKVFFSRITLEDKLGSAYEPYIFAALNSAKIMVVIGTKPEYFNAVWVKNEWSRFLSLMKKDRKRTLIPAYRNMDPYNLPKEFSHLQALDMNKLGFMSDLTRGIKKIIGEKSQSQPQPQYQPQYQPQPQPQPQPQIQQEAKPAKPKEEAVPTPKTNTRVIVNTQEKIEELKKKRTTNIIWGILFIFLFWPVSIYFFWKVHKINKEIDALIHPYQINASVYEDQSIEEKPRKGMIAWKIICFIFAGIYALGGLSQPAIFFGILGIMFWCLEKTPKSSTYMFGKESGIKKSTFVWICVIAAFVSLIVFANAM